MKVQGFDSYEDMQTALVQALAEANDRAKTHPVKIDQLEHGSKLVVFELDYGLTIYGMVSDTVDPEFAPSLTADEITSDEASIARGRLRGFVNARCYSVVCPAGEVGDTHVTSICRLISDEASEAARARGWVDEEIAT